MQEASVAQDILAVFADAKVSTAINIVVHRAYLQVLTPSMLIQQPHVMHYMQTVATVIIGHDSRS